MTDSSPNVPKFRYLFINEDYELEGTNDSALAAWLTEHGPVVDVLTGIYVNSRFFVGEVCEEWKQAWGDEKLDKGVPDNDDI